METKWQKIETAPRDGTHILGYLRRSGDSEMLPFGEWREIWYRPFILLGMSVPWHAGDPADSHSGNDAPDHFGEGCPTHWMPLPAPPQEPQR